MTNFPTLNSNFSFTRSRDPFREIARMQRDMDNLMENLMRGESEFLAPLRFQPACDVEERDSHYLLSFEVPGMSKEDMRIEVRNGQLHVYGERKRESETEDRGMYSSERRYGAMERWVDLPSDSDSASIEAKLENGILQIAVAKGAESKAKEIKIGDGRSGVFSKLIGKKPAA